MKLTEIKNIAALSSTEALVLKGGVRDTRDGTTSTVSSIIIDFVYEEKIKIKIKI